MPTLVRYISKAFDIRKGEGLRASLMFIYIFLVISSLMIVKPVCNSLFLANFGAEQLPYAFILVAIFASAVTSFYLKLMKKSQLKRIIISTIQIVVICLFGFWYLLQNKLFEGPALYAFYVWVAIFAVISTSQFWVLANVVFNAREAKRLFGFIGAGAIAGGIFGGYLTNFLAPILGSENLIFICMGALMLCIPITQTVWREYMREREDDPIFVREHVDNIAYNPFTLLKESNYLLLLSVIVAIGVLVAKLVDFQFSAIAASTIHNDDELTAFFGFWLSNLNIASLLIQLFVTRHVVGVFGVGTSLLFLPVAILIGAVSVLFRPEITSAILIKISDGSLKQSINKSGMELLALPIPAEIKKQAKSFVDVMVDSFATGVGGALLIFLTVQLQFGAREISMITIPLVIVWVLTIRRVRREYIKSFREKVERTSFPTIRPGADLKKESVIGSLIKILHGGNQRKIIQVLKMVREIQNDRLVPHFIELLHHPSSTVRLEVLKNLYFYKHLSFVHDVRPLIDDQDQDVKTEALHYLFQHQENGRLEFLEKYLNHKDYTIRGAALLCVARECKDNKKLQDLFQLKDLVEASLEHLTAVKDTEQVKFTKINCAKVIGAAHMPELYSFLHALLKDHGAAVIKAAMLSAGQTGNKEFIPVIFRFLNHSQLRNFASQALANFGPEIIDILVYFMNNKNEDKKIRLRIPKVLAQLGVQKSVDALLANLETREIGLRGRIIKALTLLRANYANLDFQDSRIIKRIVNEAKAYKSTLTTLYSQIKANDAHDKLMETSDNWVQIKLARQRLVNMLEKRLNMILERIFRLLSLRYPPEAIYDIFMAIRSKKANVRANAIEFLDNLLETNLKKVIIPIVEIALVETLMDETMERFSLKRQSEVHCLGTVLMGDDNLLKEKTLDLIAELKVDKFDRYIFKLLSDPDPLIQKKAKFALHNIGYVKFKSFEQEVEA